MIVFDLECMNGHTFEGWFDDRKDLDTQLEKGLLQCPVCETSVVEPKLSPVCVKTSSAASPPLNQAAMEASQEAAVELAEKISRFVEKNYENVGSDFATKALKMHYGAEEFRNIRGTTTQEEEKTLEKEGVPVLKFPLLKKDKEELN